MANLDRESLFSIELVVDRLSLTKSTICRFPAIAFRLLDFPTLVIHHINLDHAAAIRSKITADPYYKLPPTFAELQDRDNSFTMKKGKSCLFKVSPNSLLSHLTAAPMYVMIVDTYPDLPKLVGNCVVPLDTLMNELYDSICSNGISIPAVSGEKGTFDVFNLMGVKLGNIEIGYRLLSLGMALLPHIPASSIAKIPSEVNQTANPMDADFWKEKNLISQITVGQCDSDKTLPPVVQAEILNSRAPTSAQDVRIQTDHISGSNATTQTLKKKKNVQRLVQVEHDTEAENLDGMFITNISCPPPLFYNSELEVRRTKLYRAEEARSPESDEDLSDDGTIRPEDRFSESEFQITEYVKPELKKSKMVTKKVVKSSKRQSPEKMKGDGTVKGLMDFPILQALMSEILRFQGMPVPDEKSAQNIFSPRKQSANRTVVKSKENDSSIVLSSSMQNRMCHHCIEVPGPVPKNKSWLKSEKSAPTVVTPATGTVHKKLAPGMTHTQKLRMAKTNPKLLKELEAKEDERIQTWRRESLKNSSKHLRNQNKNLLNDLRIPLATEDLDVTQGTLGDTFETSVRSEELSMRRRRPVPTPRLSIVDTNALQQFAKQRNLLNSGKDEERFGRTGIDKQVIERDQTSRKENPDRKSGNVQFGQTMTLAVPLQQTIPEEVPKIKMDSSAILEGSGIGGAGKGEEPELRRIVEHYSDDSADEKDRGDTSSRVISPKEPELKKVVDVYSDDDSNDEHLDDTSANFDLKLGDEPNLKRIVDHYSDDSEEENGTMDGAEYREISNPSPSPRRKTLNQSKSIASREYDELMISSTSMGAETYSEAFDVISDEESQSVKYAKDVKVNSDAMLGYTWT